MRRAVAAISEDRRRRLRRRALLSAAAALVFFFLAGAAGESRAGDKTRAADSYAQLLAPSSLEDVAAGLGKGFGVRRLPLVPLEAHDGRRVSRPAPDGDPGGMPAGLTIDPDFVNRELARRQHGYGRGGRMKIEKDEAIFEGGVRGSVTLGSPIAIGIGNRDFSNWEKVMGPLEIEPDLAAGKRLTRPRPGHADLAGGMKFGATDLRDVLERASARESAARVAAGAVCKLLLAACGIEVRSGVLSVGSVVDEKSPRSFASLERVREDSPLRALDSGLEKKMVEAVDAARKQGETLGGSILVGARGVPAGLGSYVSWDRKLDGRIAQAMLSIPAVKAVELGSAIEASRGPGSLAHDEIDPAPGGSLSRRTNRAGGLEAGVTNGQELIAVIFMKPLSTLARGLDSVDLETGQAARSAYERSDVTAVPACGVIAEAMLAFVLADALLETTGGDRMEDVKERLAAHRLRVRRYPRGDARSGYPPGDRITAVFKNRSGGPVRSRAAAAFGLVSPLVSSDGPVSAQVPQLQIASAGPNGEVARLSEANEIRVVFSEPMVALGRIPPGSHGSFFRIEPAVRGAFRWSGTRTLIFTPAPPLPYATLYKVTIDKSATSESGHRLAETYTFSFTTPTLSLSKVSWYRKSGRSDSPVLVVLRFNQPVRPEGVAAGTRLTYEPHDFTAPAGTNGIDRWKKLEPAGFAAFQAKVARTSAAARPRPATSPLSRRPGTAKCFRPAKTWPCSKPGRPARRELDPCRICPPAFAGRREARARAPRRARG